MSFTYKPNKNTRVKSHGFMARNSTKAGKNIIKARRKKGRAKLTVSDVK